jgi:hypothetical protein
MPLPLLLDSNVLTRVLRPLVAEYQPVAAGMKSQLVGRYLQGGSYRHGLYLVGWFRCDRWDKMDSRWKKKRAWTREKADEELAEQAQALSTEGKQIRAFVLDATTR